MRHGRIVDCTRQQAGSRFGGSGAPSKRREHNVIVDVGHRLAEKVDDWNGMVQFGDEFGHVGVELDAQRIENWTAQHHVQERLKVTCVGSMQCAVQARVQRVVLDALEDGGRVERLQRPVASRLLDLLVIGGGRARRGGRLRYVSARGSESHLIAMQRFCERDAVAVR
jgi:hypothetical protein